MNLANGSRKLFALPAGYRPATNLNFGAPEYTGANSQNWLLVGSGGSVILNSCNDCIYKGAIDRTEFTSAPADLRRLTTSDGAVTAGHRAVPLKIPRVHKADLLSYLFATIASFGNALANVMQRKASLQKAPGHRVRRPLPARAGAQPHLDDRVPRAWWRRSSFQAVALSLGQLSSVETIITLEVPLTLLVASKVFGGKLSRQEWAAIVLMTIGMITLIGALNPRPGDEVAVDGPTYAAAGRGPALTIVVLIAVSRRARALLRTVCLGAAAGTSFGLTATLIKETISQYEVHGYVGVFTTWQTYMAVFNGILGILLMQWALHSGPLIAAQPGFTLMDPLVSILWGVLVYNESSGTAHGSCSPQSAVPASSPA